METAPPSYEAATLTDVLTVIAPYLHASDLCSATLVSRRFHKTIAPQLWGSPALHIGLEHDGIDDRLARFQKILLVARPQVRALVHTLYIPSSEALYFDDRPSDWLVTLLQRLPNLQALNVSRLLHFDHAALQALAATLPASSARLHAGTAVSRPAPTYKLGLVQRDLPTSCSDFNLKLLDASVCENVTAASLAQALPLFSSLIFLDLSGCTAARDAGVLNSLNLLWHLKILRLRAVGINDSACLVLAEAVGRRVASLDLSYNLITDKSVDVLVQSCVGNTPNYDYLSQLTALRAADLAVYRSTKMEASVTRSLTTSLVNRLAIEDLGEQGITHLYLDGNELSTASISRLLDHHALNVLDIGRARSSHTPNTRPKSARQADDNLVYLRVSSLGLIDPSYPFFHPTDFPMVRQLVLADFPSRSNTDKLVAALIRLIEQCATYEEEQRFRHHDYTAPPGVHLQAANLRTIVLEVTSGEIARTASAKTTQVPGDKSFTGHEDGQSLWDAADTDFSFFAEDEEGGWQSERTRGTQKQSTFAQPLVDNIALLSAFRKQRKLARDRQVSEQSATPGYWSGTIEVVRDARRF